MINNKSIGNGLSLAGKGAAVLAVGLGLGVCAAQPAEAVVVHSSDFGFTPLIIANGSQEIDVNNDGVNDFYFAQYSNLQNYYIPGQGYQNVGSATGKMGTLGPNQGIFGYSKYGYEHQGFVSNLSKGDVIGPDRKLPGNSAVMYDINFLFNFANLPGLYQFDFGEFPPDGYAGFLFTEDTVELYGWIKLLVAEDLSSLTIMEWAYEDTGNPIAAGEVPLPSSLLLLASGAAGVVAMRRGKKVKDPA